ncbi:3'-5' exonuclease [Ruminococcus sp. OA3]|uniref:3'-5' exonuclease n=1 Tax=Ruminococcus sp. OA3 TaxID=2914164 RepID=UPI001F061AB5|nr:3'-5' exonuclease [Ruminococcus sp. OA3]MCH1983015.1 3'-5' exonuclease [Ruminococcus sp. OA3]
MLNSYIAFDVETTGLSPAEHEIIEIGALKVRGGKVQERFIEFIKPRLPIQANITQITGISNDMVAGARIREQVIPDFLKFCEDDILIGHNIIFDYSFVENGARSLGYTFERRGIDTLNIARSVHRDLPSKSLGALCEHYCIQNKAAHRAYHDALATAKLYQTMSHFFEVKNPGLFTAKPLVCASRECPAATPKQLSLLKRLMKQKGIMQEMNMDTLTKSEASRLIDSILSGQ